MIKSWSVENVISQLQMCSHAINDPRMDGFVTWGYKQDLYKIKFALDKLLDDCPTYSIEQEWLDNQAKEKTWKIISSKIFAFR